MGQPGDVRLVLRGKFWGRVGVAMALTCPICTVLAMCQEGSLTQLVIAVQTIIRTSCPACREPWGEHALAHPHARRGRVSSCEGITAPEAR